MLDTRYITEIRFDIQSQSIFRIGNGDNDILIDEFTGLPLIPASSIAGVFKAFLMENGTETNVLEELFGSTAGEGRKSRVFFYDTYAAKYVMSENHEERTRTSIDGVTGVAISPISVTYLAGEITFQVKITIESDTKEKMKDYISLIGGCINALGNGYIRIGAHGTNGAGVFAVANARLRIFDTYLSTDLKDYLLKKEIEPSFDYNEYEVSRAVAVIEARGVHLVSPMLIKGNGKKTGDADDIQIKNIKGKYIIPGSSIKGVIRNRCCQIVDYLGMDSCIIDDIFGGKGNDDHAGSVSFADIEIAAPREKQYTGIHLDRFTAGVIKGGLYSKKPVTGNIDIKITYNDCYTRDKREVILAILLLAVRDMLTGQISLGSSFSEGFGRMQGEKISLTDAGNRVEMEIYGNASGAQKYMDILKDFRRGKDETAN